MGSENKDIILDDQQFQKTANRFLELAREMQTLEKDITTELANLKPAFRTPAGDAFFQACESILLERIKEQKKALESITTTLNQARNTYASVFREYDALNNRLGSYTR